MPIPQRKLGTPADVYVNAGQVIVLHDGTTIMLRANATKSVRYFTAWLAIVGTEAEVNAKIAELGLK